MMGKVTFRKYVYEKIYVYIDNKKTTLSSELGFIINIELVCEFNFNNNLILNFI